MVNHFLFGLDLSLNRHVSCSYSHFLNFSLILYKTLENCPDYYSYSMHLNFLGIKNFGLSTFRSIDLSVNRLFGPLTFRLIVHLLNFVGLLGILI